MENTADMRRFDPLAEVFGANFLDEEVCRQWVLKRLHGDRPRCPECGHMIECQRLPRFWANGRMECQSCGRWFDALSGTPLMNCHFRFSEFVLICMGFHWGFSNTEIARYLGLHSETVRLWRAKWISE